MDNDVLFTEILLVHGAPPTDRFVWRNEIHKWLVNRGGGYKFKVAVCIHCSTITDFTEWWEENYNG